MSVFRPRQPRGRRSRFSCWCSRSQPGAAAAGRAETPSTSRCSGSRDRPTGSSVRRARIPRCGTPSSAGGQGSSPACRSPELFAGLKPIPMIHIGTDQGRARIEAISPGRDSALRPRRCVPRRAQPGDRRVGGQVFVRVMAEMNNPRSLYAPKRAERRLEGAVALAGRLQAGVSARVPDPPRRRCRRDAPRARPAARGPRARRQPDDSVDRDLEPDRGPRRSTARPRPGVLPRRRLMSTWSGTTCSRGRGRVARGERGPPAPIRTSPTRCRSGVSRSTTPSSCAKVCTFLKTRLRTRLAAYYEARPSHRTTSARKRRTRAEYRRCITPLGAKADPPGAADEHAAAADRRPRRRGMRRSTSPSSRMRT